MANNLSFRLPECFPIPVLTHTHTQNTKPTTSLFPAQIAQGRQGQGFQGLVKVPMNSEPQTLPTCTDERKEEEMGMLYQGS